MSDIWVAVIVVGVVTIAFRAAGPVFAGGRELPPRVAGVVDLLAPVLLAALVVTQVFGGDRELVLDERAVGVGAAGVAFAARAPVLVGVVLAAAATALARAL
jgi:branched-subunit amino acid transport protein